MGIYATDGSGPWEPADLGQLWLFSRIPECGIQWDGAEVSTARAMELIERARRDLPGMPQEEQNRVIAASHLGSRWTVPQIEELARREAQL